MPVNRCPNPSCEYFNRTLPSTANVCPMCGTRLGNVIVQPSPTPPVTPPTPIPPPLPTPTPTPIVETRPIPIPIPTPISIPKPIELPPHPTPSDDATRYQDKSFPAPPPPVSPPPNNLPRVPLLRLIHSSGREFYLSGEAGYIGRQSQSMPVPPEIDLSGLPHEDIISRHHARVSWDGAHQVYTIVDMSTNGILLNGNLLTAGVLYRLTDGDFLQLGQDNLVGMKVVVK